MSLLEKLFYLHHVIFNSGCTVKNSGVIHHTKCDRNPLQQLRYLGGYSVGDPPLPIPNREVKPNSADGTAIKWESR